MDETFRHIMVLIYLVGVIGAIVAIIGAIVGFSRIKLTLEKPLKDEIEKSLAQHGLPKSSGDITALKEDALGNPTYTWATYQISPTSSISVPAPRIQWSKVRTQEKGKDLQKVFRQQFLDKFGDKLKGWYVYPVATYGENFLENMAQQLQARDIHVLSLMPYEPPPLNSKVAFFDVSYNTGNALEEALSKLQEGVSPELYLFLVFNDLLPTWLQAKPWSDKQLKLLYRLSDIFEFGTERKEITDALKVIQGLLYRTLSWDDVRVKKALKILRTTPLS